MLTNIVLCSVSVSYIITLYITFLILLKLLRLWGRSIWLVQPWLRPLLNWCLREWLISWLVNTWIVWFATIFVRFSVNNFKFLLVEITFLGAFKLILKVFFYLCPVVFIRLTLIVCLILIQIGVIPNSVFLPSFLPLIRGLLVLIGPLSMNLTLCSNCLALNAVPSIDMHFILPLCLLITGFLWSTFGFKFLFVDHSVGLVHVIHVPVILIVYNVWVYTVIHVLSSWFYLPARHLRHHFLVVLHWLANYWLRNVDVTHILKVLSVVQWQ